MADKPIQLVAGVLTQVEATVTSAGAANAGDIVALDANGLLDTSMMPVGIGADTASVTTSENIASGSVVNVWNSSGAKARKADATAAGKTGMGFVLATTTSGQSATVYFEGRITGLSSLTPGARYYLDTTAGGITATPPSSAGNIVQVIGYAISDTVLSFEPGDPVTLA